ncbi:MAG: S-layer homology domain-containing protein [Oscillospiraceae bacterium]|nr:S-layer homology domain-containing protein [Oscillospiraceae bacterium]
MLYEFFTCFLHAAGTCRVTASYDTRVNMNNREIVPAGATGADGAMYTGGDRFAPDAPITRQDMMTLIDRTLRAVGTPLPADGDADLSAFSDERDVAAYARDAAASLTAAGIIQGNAGRLRPLGQTTRAEMAVTLYRLLTPAAS